VIHRTLTLLALAALTACAPHHRGAPAPAPAAESPALPAPAWRPIARSTLGAPIEALTIGDGPKRILIIGAIHGNEPDALPAIDPLLARLSAAPPPATVRIIRDINPDGTAAATRGNSRGVDLNRNWPTVNFRPSRRHGREPLSETETRALHDEIAAFEPGIIIVCHSIRSGPFVNYDGPASEPAERFARAAAQSDPRWHVRASMGYPTPGSLGTWAGVERNIPILTIEFQRGQDAQRATRALIDGVTAVIEDAAPG
jgi:murein peptide amidase A